MKLIKIVQIPNGIKLNLKMRLTILFMVVSLIQMNAENSYSQNVKITINLNNVDVSTVLDEIENLTDFSIYYRDSQIDLTRKVSINVKKERIKNILEFLFSNTNVDYQLIDNNIILTDHNQSNITPKTYGVQHVSYVQQQQTITGVVTDATGMALPSVNILIVGSTVGTQTDFDGNYTIEAAEGDTLLFSFVGMKSVSMVVGTDLTIDVQMEDDTNALDEVIVVGYGTQKKVTVTGAISAIKGDVLAKDPVINLSNSLAGRLAGVVAIQTSGEPGFDDSTITIRGINTIGNSSPLIVIDGIPDRSGGLSRLNANDIESMSVLKDASAAIYGSRAANGAIIITTKRGSANKSPTVTYNYHLGFSQPTVIPDLANAVEYATIINEGKIFNAIPANEWSAAYDAISTNGSYTSPTSGIGTLNASFSPEDIELHANGSDPWGHPDTDWFDDLYKDWTPEQKHSLIISGGNDIAQYFTSFEYLDQDAFYKNSATRYQQYGWRTNLDVKINDYIKTSFGILLRRETRNFPTQDANAIFRMTMRGKPTDIAVYPNGKPGPDIENGQNPVVITTNATGYDKSNRDYIQLNGAVDISNPWVEGLVLTLSAAVDIASWDAKKWETPWTLYNWDGISYEDDGTTPLLVGNIRSNFTDPRLTQTHLNELNTNLSAILRYDTTFGAEEDHNLGVMMGVTKETFEGDGYFAFRRNYLSTAVDQLFAGGTEAQNTGGSGYERARLGYYGRVQYNYKEKYLAEFIWRYDGSYIFPESSRFGFFPGVLLGWNVSKENFFNVDFINHMKIRASYGEMGNDQVFFNDELQEYAFLSTYGFGEYPIDHNVVTTLGENLLANPNFTWERAKNTNIGLDMRVLDNHLDFTFEYFYNKRDQMLLRSEGSTPNSTGITNLLPPENIGEMINSGFDLTVNYNGGSSSSLRYNIGFNGGYAKNEVIFLDEVPGIPEYQKEEGKSYGGYLVYQSDGVFRDEADIASETLDYSGVSANLRPGDMKFKDVDGNGIIDADDRVRLNDNGTPTFNYGFSGDLSWKNFDLSILFQGATGASLRIQTESGDIGNYLKYSYDHRWSIDNPSSVHPRLPDRGDTYYTGGNFGNNTYFLFSKNYLRLKVLSLGYNLPSELIGKIGFEMIRFTLSGSNLYTWDKYDIFDPESTATSGVFYPPSRIISTGITLTF